MKVKKRTIIEAMNFPPKSDLVTKFYNLQKHFEDKLLGDEDKWDKLSTMAKRRRLNKFKKEMDDILRHNHWVKELKKVGWEFKWDKSGGSYSCSIHESKF